MYRVTFVDCCVTRLLRVAQTQAQAQAQQMNEAELMMMIVSLQLLRSYYFDCFSASVRIAWVRRCAQLVSG